MKFNLTQDEILNVLKEHYSFKSNEKPLIQEEKKSDKLANKKLYSNVIKESFIGIKTVLNKK